MGKKKELQVFNTLVLEKIRVAIVNGLAHGDLKLNQDYKLSQVNEKRQRFLIESLTRAMSESRAKSALKHTFRYLPKLKGITTFIEMKVEKEYEYLLAGEKSKLIFVDVVK